MPFDVLKRAAEVVGAVVVLYGAVAGVIIACGGTLPPWYTPAQAQTLEQSLKSFEASEAIHDKKIDANLDLLTLERLRDDARAANEKADKNPRDPDAKANAWFSQKKLEIFFKTHPSLAEAMH